MGNAFIFSRLSKILILNPALPQPKKPLPATGEVWALEKERKSPHVRVSWQHDKKRACSSPSGFLLFLPVSLILECSSSSPLLLWGVIGAPNDIFSRVKPSPLDDHCWWVDTQAVPSALELTYACARQMRRSLLDVSFVLNKQGGGAGTELITAQVKSSQLRSGRLVGYAALVFYLQTCSIALPRSNVLGVRAGRLQASGLSLKKSVTCSSRCARVCIHPEPRSFRERSHSP